MTGAAVAAAAAGEQGSSSTRTTGSARSSTSSLGAQPRSEDLPLPQLGMRCNAEQVSTPLQHPPSGLEAGEPLTRQARRGAVSLGFTGLGFRMQAGWKLCPSTHPVSLKPTIQG